MPAIPGLGSASGFEFVLQSTTSDDPRKLAAALGTLLQQANGQPELSQVFSTYRANVPQIYLDIDREKVKTLGISLNDVFTTLQSTLGAYYVNDFNKFGRVYQVRLQSDAAYRQYLQNIKEIHVTNSKGKPVPLETLMTTRMVFGLRSSQNIICFRRPQSMVRRPRDAVPAKR